MIRRRRYIPPHTMKPLLSAKIVVVLLVVWTSPSFAQQLSGCGKDTDCKGDRICVDGKCVSPTSGTATTPPETGTTTTPPATGTTTTPPATGTTTTPPATGTATTQPPPAPTGVPVGGPYWKRPKGPFDAQLTVGLYGTYDNFVGGGELLAAAGIDLGDSKALQVVGSINVLYPGAFNGVLGAGYRWKRHETIDDVAFARIAVGALIMPNPFGTALGLQIRGDVLGPIFGSPNLFALTTALNLFEAGGQFGATVQFSFGLGL